MRTRRGVTRTLVGVRLQGAQIQSDRRMGRDAKSARDTPRSDPLHGRRDAKHPEGSGREAAAVRQACSQGQRTRILENIAALRTITELLHQPQRYGHSERRSADIEQATPSQDLPPQCPFDSCGFSL